MFPPVPGAGQPPRTRFPVAPPLLAPPPRGTTSAGTPPRNFVADSFTPPPGLGPQPAPSPYSLPPGLGPQPAPAPFSLAPGLGSPPPGTITVGNDPTGDILNDPAFMELKNLLSAQGISNKAQLRAAIQQALIQFGAVPDLPGGVLSDSGLDTGLTQQLASNNPFSVLKQLTQRFGDAQTDTKNQLAARGILNSGETGFQLGRLGQQQGQSQYDATNSLLGNIGSLEAQYAAGQQAAAQQLAQGAITAEQNAAANGNSGATATYDPATGLYRDPAGNYYDKSGNPASPPAAPSAPAAPPPAATPPTYTPGTIVQPGTAIPV